MGISLESVSGEIISILAPLPSYFSSTDKAVETFNRLGYGPSAADLAPVAADLAQLADDINKLVDAGEQFAADRAAGNAGLTELLKLIAEIALVLKDLAAVPGKLPALNLDPKFFLALFQMLVVDYLRQERPALYASLELLGVIDQSFVPAQAGGPAVSCTKLEIHWDRLVQIVEHTGQWARDVYGWGTSDFRHALFLLRVSSVFDAFGLFAPVVEIPDDILTKFFPSGATLSPRPQSLRFPLYHDEPAPDTVVELGIMGLPVEGKTAPTDQDVGIGVMPYADGVVEGTIPITDEHREHRQTSHRVGA